MLNLPRGVDLPPNIVPLKKLELPLLELGVSEVGRSLGFLGHQGLQGSTQGNTGKRSALLCVVIVLLAAFVSCLRFTIEPEKVKRFPVKPLWASITAPSSSIETEGRKSKGFR